MEPESSDSALDALNNRELELFSILSQGYSTRQIHSEFGIAPAELQKLKEAIQKKLGLKSDVQLIQAAARHARGGRT